jgi:hypothetical protein
MVNRDTGNDVHVGDRMGGTDGSGDAHTRDERDRTIRQILNGGGSVAYFFFLLSWILFSCSFRVNWGRA